MLRESVQMVEPRTREVEGSVRGSCGRGQGDVYGNVLPTSALPVLSTEDSVIHFPSSEVHDNHLSS